MCLLLLTSTTESALGGNHIECAEVFSILWFLLFTTTLSNSSDSGFVLFYLLYNGSDFCRGSSFDFFFSAFCYFLQNPFRRVNRGFGSRFQRPYSHRTYEVRTTSGIQFFCLILYFTNMGDSNKGASLYLVVILHN